MSRQTINAIERGKHQPTLEPALRIAHLFERPLDDVFLFFSDAEINYENLRSLVIEITRNEPVS